MARQGNNPKRRVEEPERVSDEQVESLIAQARYVGSGHHKRYPLDYGFERTNPVPTKSLCDVLRPVRLSEAQELLEQGIRARMVSRVENGFPKYVWTVAADGVVYEAKCDPDAPGRYHGYPLEHEQAVRDYIATEWKRRCR
ncbi:hypothetical protein [Pleomorphomonas sp. NRK KF1]|uniref:hypothetical protein n=1 Tax=Pleomorphomonas sp. NRK KF1 TaxID=2943000 RepID=UPI002044658B|nr:hypothetical protein [Pleomorphomonas sp. NRK KF1]MCM5555286.1 hypothetical protein [Pleomorphomonas sp. NRK KF1]